MSRKGYNVHVPYTTYSGNEQYPALCDVCGKKFKKYELIEVKDKFNLENRLVVCRRDLDKAQPQLRPFIAREYKAPKITRPEPYLQNYPNIPNPNSDKVPGICTGLNVTVDSLSNLITLQWLGPFQGGSDEVTFYNIYQAWPQLSEPLLIGTTINGAPFYQDLLTPITAICTYYVQAVNIYGAGPLSAPVFFPNIEVDLSNQYFVFNAPLYQTFDVTGVGAYFLIGTPNG